LEFNTSNSDFENIINAKLISGEAGDVSKDGHLRVMWNMDETGQILRL